MLVWLGQRSDAAVSAPMGANHAGGGTLFARGPAVVRVTESHPHLFDYPRGTDWGSAPANHARRLRRRCGDTSARPRKKTRYRILCVTSVLQPLLLNLAGSPPVPPACPATRSAIRAHAESSPLPSSRQLPTTRTRVAVHCLVTLEKRCSAQCHDLARIYRDGYGETDGFPVPVPVGGPTSAFSAH